MKKKHKSGLALGDYLGDLTNELDEGERIVGFSSTGPKSYSFLTNLGRGLV